VLQRPIETTRLIGMWARTIAFRLGGEARNQAVWILAVKNRETISEYQERNGS
jgi:hypothetical protein